MDRLYEAIVSLCANDTDGALQKCTGLSIRWQRRKRSSCSQIESEFMHNILDTAAATATATAKRAHLSLIAHAMSLMDPTGMYFVPSILSEVIVATKEVNDKTHDVAYALQAGLADTTPHMVSAAITSLSRLLFEFRKDLDPAMVSEMISTMHLFVNSSYREIVKSALGFIKVTTISLDVEIVRLHLQEIVSGIIRWSHEHKGHLKVRVRHILERLIWRFGYDDIVAFVPEADKKLLVNIKKCRERAKRKKANASEMEMDGEAHEEGEETAKKSNKPQTTFGSAYEDALYGSESDLSDDDDDQEEDDTTGKTTQKKSNKKKQGADAWIKEDGDTPLDFLDRTVVSRATASHPSTQVAPEVKDLSSAFNTSNGKLSDSDGADEDSDEKVDQETMDLDQAESNYLESLKSADGFTRGQGGKIRFNKTNRRGAQGKDEDMDMDMEMAGGAGPIRSKLKEKKQAKSQERDSQEPQHAEGEERGSAIQSELETTRRLVKTMEATDLSMAETREKLKTFYKTADETNALLDMWGTCTKTASGSCLGRIQYRASSGTSPLSFHSSQTSGRQTTTFAKQQPLKKPPSELVAAAHAHAFAIAANRKRNPIH
ncbi:MAG: hypothetical protein J3Q66DRAFT_369382 [Benniella sp.]|nr:MAG: hypothetical protein J3Q66DRAFT_369382 [Benniella sp.]